MGRGVIVNLPVGFVVKDVLDSQITFAHPEALLVAENGHAVISALQCHDGAVIVDECHKVEDWTKKQKTDGLDFTGSLTKLAEYRFDDDTFEVTDEMKRQFDEVGYILVRGLLTADELTKVKGTLENSDLVSKYGYGIPDASGRMPKMVLWRSPGSDVTGMVCRCEKVVTTSEELLGSEVYHYSSKLMMKEPYIGGRQEWHQDYGYWYQNGLMFPDALSVFIAVDKCTKANGCLQILPASHKCGRIEHKFVSGQTGADVERVKEISEKLPLIHVEMNPGDALFFHCNVLHQSDPNNSPDKRWALILAYNCASNNPIESLAPPFPRYTPLKKVPNSAILECTNETDFSGKEFLNPLDDKTVKAETQKPGNT